MKKPKRFRPKTVVSKRYKRKEKSARAKGYDNGWDRYRRRFLYYNPYCYRCGGESEVVDHIVPHKGDEELFRKLDNHCPLCARCHNYLTGKFDRHEDPKTEDKIKDIQDNRRVFSINTKIKVLGSYQSRSRR